MKYSQVDKQITSILNDPFKKNISFVILILSISLSTNAIAQSLRCSTNDIFFSEEMEQKGTYRCDAKIESAGTIGGDTRFRALNEIFLNSGFYASKDVNFEADNLGCNNYASGWSEQLLRQVDNFSWFLPPGYITSFDCVDATCFYSGESPDGKVSFGLEYGPDIPFLQEEFTEPLPLTFGDYNKRQIIYSAFDNELINGVCYYRTILNNAIQGTYLQWFGSFFKIELNFYTKDDVSFNELISILETIFSNIE